MEEQRKKAPVNNSAAKKKAPRKKGFNYMKKKYVIAALLPAVAVIFSMTCCSKVSLSADSVSTTWNALKEAHCPRLQVCAPVSSVRMEYLFHLKPAGLSEIVEKVILECKKHTDNIEFIAEDALRSDRTFLHSLIKKVIDCGVRRISFQEAAGVSLPDNLPFPFSVGPEPFVGEGVIVAGRPDIGTDVVFWCFRMCAGNRDKQQDGAQDDGVFHILFFR